jgi:hypothetical protein
MSLLLVARKQARIGIISEMMLRGLSYVDIDLELQRQGFPPTSYPTLNNDIKLIMADWANKRSMSVENRVGTELEHLEAIRRKALEGFDRSRLPAETEEVTTKSESSATLNLPSTESTPTAIEAAVARIMNGNSAMRSTEQVVKHKTVGQTGDPRFLDVALGASKEVRNLLGIDAPSVKKIELTTTTSTATPEELRAMDPAELARLVADEVARAQATEQL